MTAFYEFAVSRTRQRRTTAQESAELLKYSAFSTLLFRAKERANAFRMAIHITAQGRKEKLKLTQTLLGKLGRRLAHQFRHAGGGLAVGMDDDLGVMLHIGDA